MGIVLALPKLYDDVVARFTSDGTDAVNYFGWREDGRQRKEPNRILWAPGDASGTLGPLLPARNPGRNPRPIATLGELFVVRIVAHDPADHEDERVQYQAARELYDAWWRAVYLAAHGTVQQQSAKWMVDKKERRHGAAIEVVCAIEAMIPDAPLTAAPVDTDAQIELEVLDASETQTITP